MNKTNIFLMTIALTMLSAFTPAADRIIQVRDLGVDGEHRLYDVICASGEGITLFHYIGEGTVIEFEEMPAEDADIINLESLDVGSVSGGDIEIGDKPKVCTAMNEGDLDCAEYEDIDTAAEAVCKKLI